MKPILCIVSSGTSQELVGHLLAAIERMPKYDAPSIVPCNSSQEEELFARGLQRTFSRLEVTVLDSEIDLHDHLQTIFPVQLRDQPEEKVKILLVDTVIRAQLLLQSLAVPVAQECLPDFQKIVSETEVLTLRHFYCRESFLLHPMPKRCAEWLQPKIGRTGRRESSRSLHAHRRQARGNNNSSRRR